MLSIGPNLLPFTGNGAYKRPNMVDIFLTISNEINKLINKKYQSCSAYHSKANSYQKKKDKSMPQGQKVWYSGKGLVNRYIYIQNSEVNNV
jgi:hypothetical protein